MRDRLQRKTTLVGNYISSTPNSQNDYRKIRTRKNFVFGHFTQRCLVSIFQFTKTVSITLPCSEPYETSKMPLTKRRYFHQTLHCRCLSKFWTHPCRAKASTLQFSVRKRECTALNKIPFSWLIFTAPVLIKKLKPRSCSCSSQQAITFSKLAIDTLEQRCEICSKLTIKPPKRRQLYC